MDRILRVGALRRFPRSWQGSTASCSWPHLSHFSQFFEPAFQRLRLVSHMAPVTVYDIFGGDSDLSDVPLGYEWDISPPPTRNTATKQNPSSSKLTARLSARNRSQNHGNLGWTTTSERPARSTRRRSSYTTSASSSNSDVSHAFSPSPPPSPPPFSTPASRKRKTRPSEIPIKTTPTKRQKKQERSLFDDLVGAKGKTTTPSKYAAKEFPIGMTPCQSPSRQEQWSFRVLQDTRVFVKLLRTNGSPAAPDAPFAEIYWWPARVSNIFLLLIFPIYPSLVERPCHP